MINDMNTMQNRIQGIQDRIQTIENNPLNIGTEQANTELEGLRLQLDQAVQAQEEMNQAIQQMDIPTANNAYIRLSNTISGTERYIRDNVDEQGRFNQEINEGVANADNLMNTIKGAVAAYATMQTAEKVIELSDTMVQTTARLDLIVDDGGSIDDLQNMIYLSAQRARGDYLSTADAVYKLGTQASQAFSSNEEIIAFTELLNKQFTIAGTEVQSVNAAMLQLTQAWQSFQNTALMAFQPVLQRMNDLANSEAFNTMVQNGISAVATLAGITLDVFDMMAQAGQFVSDNWSIISPIIYGVAAALAIYAGYLAVTKAAEMASAAVKAILIVAEYAHAAATHSAVAATTAQTAAQMGLNTALLACPITWIIILIIALIALFYAEVAAVNKFAGTSVSATGIICGVFMVAAAFIGNLFVTLINFVIDIFVVLWNFIAAFANFFANVFTDPVGAIARLFFDLVDTVLSLLQSLASAIDTIFGSNLSGAVQGWRDSLESWVDSTFGKGEEVMATLNADDMHLGCFEYGAAWDAGYNFGEGIDESISNFDPASLFDVNIPSASDYSDLSNYTAGIGDGVGDIADNTGSIADSMDITEEDLKYLRDIAEQETINRFTTAEINVDMSGMQNTVNNGMDLDGVVDGLTDAVNEAIDAIAEGVHE